jgi:hypothetical protein
VNSEHPRAVRSRERVDWLSHHPLVINAARVGEVFGQDPIALLREEGDPLLTDIRLAALAVHNRDEEERGRRANRKR